MNGSGLNKEIQKNGETADRKEEGRRKLPAPETLETLKTHPLWENLNYLLRWTAFALAAGVLGGAAGGVFGKLIRLATGVRAGRPLAVLLLPFLGLLIVFLYRKAGEEGNRGTNMVFSFLTEDDDITPATGPLIFVSTVLSHLGGASVGREGAALQLGGWLGSQLGKLLRFSRKDRRIAVMCGMAGVFAALFGTPVAAAVFCIEVTSVGIFHYEALVPCILSAFTGSYVAQTFFGAVPEAWQIASVPETGPASMGLAVLLGLCCAVLSILLVVCLHTSEHFFKERFKNPYVRVFAAGAVFAAATLLLGTQDYTGSGTVLIDIATEGEVRPAAFVLKLLFTAVAVGSGFKGGEIVPTLSIGASFGALFGALTGFPVSLSAACGMIALFAGATNCPVASVLIAMEMFSDEGLPFFAIAVALSFTLSGYYSLYGSQHFIYGKTKGGFLER